MKAVLSAIIAVMAISTTTDAAHGRDMACRGILKNVENTDNVKIGPCVFTKGQYSGVTITDKCRFGQLCRVQARVVRDNRGLWVDHAYRANPLGFDSSPAAPAQTSVIRDLVSIGDDLGDMCRRWPVFDFHTIELCRVRDKMDKTLNALGYCSGKQDEYSSQMSWRKCTRDSLRAR